MLNIVNLMGRMTKDPEVRYTTTEIPVARFSVACQRDYSGMEGGQPKTDFFDIECWRGTAEFAQKYFHKGDMVALSGRLQTDKWTDKEGRERTAIKVVANNLYFGESKRGNQAAAPATSDFIENDGDLPF